MLNTRYNIYFNVIPPGSIADAIFYGSMNGDWFETELSIKVIYTIRVYQVGANKNNKAQHGLKLFFK